MKMINIHATLFGIMAFYIFINLACASIDLVAEIDYYPKNASVGDNVTVIQTIKNLGDVNLTVYVARTFYPGIGVATPYTIPANSEINITFHIPLHYGKIIIKVEVDTMNTINETNETNNNATLTFYFPVFVKTDKKKYRIGEQVIGNIIGYNGSGHVFVKSSFPFKVFKFENGSWREIEIRRPCVGIICSNNKLSYTTIHCIRTRRCEEVFVNSSWTWYQEHWIWKEDICGNQTYDRLMSVLAEPGQYKFGLYYGAGGGLGFKGCELYVESEPFTILQNCSSDLDCASGEKCINETCQPINYCENDFHCNYNQICINNTCVNLSYASIDLVAEIDYYPKNASVGDNVTVIQTIKNLGDVNLTDVRIAFIDSNRVGKLGYFNISANSEINFTFNFTINYGRFTVETIVDYDNIINETNETNNNATLIFEFRLSSIKTDKEMYKIGEPINIGVTGNWSSSIGIKIHDGIMGAPPFDVFKFENGTWKKLRLTRPFMPGFRVCSNGTLTYVLISMGIQYCGRYTVNSSLTWNQQHVIEKNLTCGNETYIRWERVPVGPGVYKFALEYGDFYSIHACGPFVYIESNNFTILQNCSSDLDCASGEKCINETCRPINYCEKDFQCDYNQICINNTCVNLSCEYWQIAVNHTCVTAPGYCKDNTECPPGYYCSDHRCISIPYTPRYTGRGTVVIDVTPPEIAQPLPLKEFSVEIPEEIIGLTITFNLGKDARDAEVTAIVRNKTSKSIVDVNGTVNVTIPGYGKGKIIISKAGYKNLTKNITVYAGKLNITKIFGEKYGDKFKFKVTDEKGNAVKDAEVEIHGEKLKTDIQGIVEKEIKTIQKGLIASATKENYKNSSLTFDVNIIGTLKIIAPKSANEGEKIIVKVTDKNNNPVANASVDVSGKEYITNEKGEIEIIVTQTLSLKASKEGYSTSDEVSVIAKSPRAVCGNGKCETGETRENCPQDCIICGDGYCDKGEDYKSCPTDCQKPEELPLLIIIGVVIMLSLFTYFLIFRKK